MDKTKEKCSKCGRIEKKASADNPDGLTLLMPDNEWICNSCLHHEGLNKN